MDKVPGQSGRAAHLYPPIDPFDQRMIDRGDGHHIYVERCGTPGGIPVIVLHGGPGGGCSPAMRRFFDPDKYHIILFDQRGCGRSRPLAHVADNTTWHLVEDIEFIRNLFDLGRVILFGGSWGAALALIHAQAHPDAVRALVLRGVFLMSEPELDWFYGGGAGQFWPDLWARFRDAIPTEEQSDLVAAYHRRLFSGDMMSEMRFARVWSAWENSLASIDSNGMAGDGPSDHTRAFARLEAHYFVNKGFLGAKDQILARMDRIRHLPGHIVQGRYDMICPPAGAWALHHAWPGSHLSFVGRAGHAMSEPGIAAELVRIMDGLAEAE